MNFDIANFARTNKIIFIWAAFGMLLYLFRDLFGLVFITFLMCFITGSLTDWISRHGRAPRRVIVACVYLLFLVLIGGFLFILTPRLVTETRSFTDQLPRALAAINLWLDARVAEHPGLVPALEQVRSFMTPEQMIVKGWGIGRGLLETGLQYVSWFFIALMFSFMIMMDLPRLAESARGLRHTRMASAYEETAGSVVLFGRVVGNNFRAQMMISAVNTVLTGICLLFLGVNGIALLCTLVFLCGLVPVLGGFISSVPVILMSINSGGIEKGAWMLLLIIGISILETYVLNPRIVSAVMHINPVMTLIILFIGHSFFGLWGMLLGVPVAVYIYRQLIIGAAPVRAAN